MKSSMLHAATLTVIWIATMIVVSCVTFCDIARAHGEKGKHVHAGHETKVTASQQGKGSHRLRRKEKAQARKIQAHKTQSTNGKQGKAKKQKTKYSAHQDTAGEKSKAANSSLLVTEINGHLVAKEEFVEIGAHPPFCDHPHFHAANGSFVTALDGTKILDPEIEFGNHCGFDMLKFSPLDGGGPNGGGSPPDGFPFSDIFGATYDGPLGVNLESGLFNQQQNIHSLPSGGDDPLGTFISVLDDGLYQPFNPVNINGAQDPDGGHGSIPISDPPPGGTPATTPSTPVIDKSTDKNGNPKTTVAAGGMTVTNNHEGATHSTSISSPDGKLKIKLEGQNLPEVIIPGGGGKKVKITFVNINGQPVATTKLPPGYTSATAADGTITITAPDGSTTTMAPGPDGSTVITGPDGTTTTVTGNGTTVRAPDGTTVTNQGTGGNVVVNQGPGGKTVTLDPQTGNTTTTDNPPAPSGTPGAGSTPPATPPGSGTPSTPKTPAIPPGAWNPSQSTPTLQQVNAEQGKLDVMTRSYASASQNASKQPGNKELQKSAQGIATELKKQGDKVALMKTQFAVQQTQVAAAAKNAPKPTSPEQKTTTSPGASVGAVANIALDGQAMRPDQLATMQNIAARFKGTRDLAGAAEAVLAEVGSSFVWSNEGDYMNGARTQDTLLSARQMACFEFVHFMGFLTGPQKTTRADSLVPFTGSSAAGVKSRQYTTWDRSSEIPRGKIVIGVARMFNNNAGYYHVGISLGGGKIISLGGDVNLHIADTADLFPRWGYSEVQIHDYNFMQQQGDRPPATE